MANDTVQWIQVGTGDDYFMSVSVGEVQIKLRKLGLHVVTDADMTELAQLRERCAELTERLAVAEATTHGLRLTGRRTSAEIGSIRGQFLRGQKCCRVVRRGGIPGRPFLMFAVQMTVDAFVNLLIHGLRVTADGIFHSHVDTATDGS